jgi:hypothetical protein
MMRSDGAYWDLIDGFKGKEREREKDISIPSTKWRKKAVLHI